MINRFTKKIVKVVGSDTVKTWPRSSLNLQKINIAVKQALSIWAAEAPIYFKIDNKVSDADADIYFRFSDLGNPTASLGNASGTINTQNKLFIEAYGDEQIDNYRFEKEKDPILDGPYDLVAIIGHEAGHQLGLDHPPLDNNEVETHQRALMSTGFSPYEINRQASIEYDMPSVKALYQNIYVGQSILCDIKNNVNVVSTTQNGYSYDVTEERLLLFGKNGTSCKVYAFVGGTKNKFMNSVSISFKNTKNCVVNKIDIFNGIEPVQSYYVCARSFDNENLFKPWDIKLGLLNRPKIKLGLFLVIEVLFLRFDEQYDAGAFQLTAIKAEPLFEPPIVNNIPVITTKIKSA